MIVAADGDFTDAVTTRCGCVFAGTPDVEPATVLLVVCDAHEQRWRHPAYLARRAMDAELEDLMRSRPLSQVQR